MSLNRVIGRDNQIPWRIPEDFRWFKQLTMGHVLVMGRKTFESIGRPLPGRTTLVLSRSPGALEGVQVVRSLDEVLEAGAALPDRKIFVCGGAQVYAEALPLCSELYLTVVQQHVEGDAFFPAFEHIFPRSTVIAREDRFHIIHYTR